MLIAEAAGAIVVAGGDTLLTPEVATVVGLYVRPSCASASDRLDWTGVIGTAVGAAAVGAAAVGAAAVGTAVGTAG